MKTSHDIPAIQSTLGKRTRSEVFQLNKKWTQDKTVLGKRGRGQFAQPKGNVIKKTKFTHTVPSVLGKHPRDRKQYIKRNV